MRDFCLILASGIFAIVIFQWTTRTTQQQHSSHSQNEIIEGKWHKIKRSQENHYHTNVNTPKNIPLISSEVIIHEDETTKTTTAFDYDDDEFDGDDEDWKSSITTSAATKTIDDNDYSDGDDEDEYESSSSTTTITTTIDDDDQSPSSSSRSFQDEIWPRLKQKLCPNMIPNTSLAKKILFHLSRQRLGLSQEYQRYLSSSRDDDDMYNRFFDFHVAINAYDPKAATSKKRGKRRRNNNYIMGYVPIWKCANDQIRFAMKETLGDDNFDHRGEDFRIFFERTLPSITSHPPCLVTVIRDPISHFLSAYNEIEVRYMRQYNVQRKRDQYYDDFAYTRYDAGSTTRFIQFVTDILSHPKVIIKIFPLGVAPIKLNHVYLMSGILVALAQYNATLTDYLPSLTNLTNVWPKFVSSTCGETRSNGGNNGGGGGGVTFPESFATTPLNEMAGRHDSETDERGFREAAERVWEEGGVTAEVLCILHVMDYACFDKLEIPPFCQNVYNDDEFVRRIMEWDGTTTGDFADTKIGDDL